MTKEIWKFVPGYEGLYMVSNLGRVKSCDRYVHHPRLGKKFVKGKIMNLRKTRKGYLQVHLSKNGYVCFYLVHRIVAMAFIPNPDNLPQVNHINEDKTDNRVENLEWCTATYNLNYGNHNEKVSKAHINGKDSKKVNQFTLDGKLVREWPSTSEITRSLGYYVSACCRGVYKQAYGFIWRYQN